MKELIATLVADLINQNMAERKLRVMRPNESDRFMPHNDLNLHALTEIINNTREKLRVELVEGDETNFKTITVLLQSESYEVAEKQKTVIGNQIEEISRLKKEVEEMEELKAELERLKRMQETVKETKPANRRRKEVMDVNN